ncbi:hypothetical protein D9619_012084 [Psilocybe cf. subviscida]|uniref:RlpA-like protein double-psi beta-barrel domain-containing protein n=1 Tax=Psilocybe cf. subviscida TaxID=2480587 RepID=A0A8H5EZM0_9AGAR|nr:hypothetical protein D9619_012084 [Psilocybe cf. subviscida]
MRSFTQSHSFLLVAILFCLASPSYVFGGITGTEASEIPKLNNTDPVQHTVPSLHNGRRRRHSEISNALAVSRDKDMTLYPGRRAAGASFTHFVTGLGACGHFNVPSDFIVAISQLHWQGGKFCGETITITAKGKTAQATIMDECMGCGFNDIDLTDGLYRFFDPAFIGEFTGDWEFGSGGPAPKPSPSPPPPSKKPAPPPPTTTSSQVHHTTSSKSSIQPTSSKASTSSITTATSQSGSSSSSSVASATATTNPTVPPVAGNLGNMFDTLINLGGLIVQTVPSSS